MEKLNWRAVLTLKDNNRTMGENFPNKEKADAWVLEQAEKFNLKTSLVADKTDMKNTREINHFD